MAGGRRVLDRSDVMEGIPEMAFGPVRIFCSNAGITGGFGLELTYTATVAGLLDEIQVEATFRDGTKLVTIHWPIP
jgi:urease gamma subunit